MTMPNNIHPKLERLDSVFDEKGNHSRNEFSWTPCDCCGSRLGGERYEVKAVYWNKRAPGNISVMRGTFWVCVDCLND